MKIEKIGVVSAGQMGSGINTSSISITLHRGLGDDKYRPCPLLRQHVDAGFLGRKSRRGFYRYGE